MFKMPKLTLLGLSVLLVVLGDCKKKTVSAPPAPPAPSVAAPEPQSPPKAPLIVQFTAEPTSIQRGQSSILRWQVTGDLTSASINHGIGTVRDTDQRQVSPADSTTFTLSATGPGGTSIASATINVTLPPPPPPETAAAPPPGADIGTRLSSEVQDAYFDYDSAEIRSDAKAALLRDGDMLKAILADFPRVKILIEGYCDERGSAEYNLGLGDRRSEAAQEFLAQLGIPAARLQTISYGKERPQCSEHAEECWQKNRRVHFSPGLSN